MEEWPPTVLSRWFPFKKQMEKRRLSAMQDATLDMSAVTNNSLGRTRAGPRWHLCCSCVVEAEDDGRNPIICEEKEESAWHDGDGKGRCLT
ncbi:hypothetical protein DEO72_LG5g1522 [Vigna unguiculata]|uniref:Uncharacterized protein n=1 Tax=Vigna unguiculata TaxID=3917 RepID=A0A4D6LXM8_VIGUN|nr:hypothetical protein DEO72_LG5g1522 [Vigna unguiculata]